MRTEETGLLTTDLESGTETDKGLITSLQDYSVHDGYGLRLLVFLKGCPLRCRWCQNPEAVNPYLEIEYRALLCQRCGRCKAVCPVEGAIIDPLATEDKSRRIDRAKCTRCGLCVKNCPADALSFVGQWMTVAQVMDKIERLIPFMRGSGDGGVTISGGDPLGQPRFSYQILKASRELGVHTAIETCGFGRWEILSKLASKCDLVMYDIKHMDDEMHKKGTGQSNKIVLENFTRLINETDVECVVRLPLIPGFNDSPENVRQTAQFLASLKRPVRLDLLSFNELAASKYRILGLEAEYDYLEAQKQSRETMDSLVGIASACGIQVTTEGLW